jgi:hypothetical protein
LGGKPDALINGENVEISNRLTLQRRPGLIPYGVSLIDPPDAFFAWELATTGDIVLVIDTIGGNNSANGQVLNYSPTYSGAYITKSLNANQTNFIDIVNTLYLGNGSDLYKITGPNLLTQSNTFGTGAGTDFSIQSPWAQEDIFALTGGQADPVNGFTATQIVWSTSSSFAYLKQTVVPNYTPVANNVFTFSIWMMVASSQTITLSIHDQSGTIATNTVTLTSSWAKYQVTGTMGSGSNEIIVEINNPTSTNAMVIYGAQLEVGGPATTTQITTTKPQGVYLWGIQAPPSAPTLSYTNAAGKGAPGFFPNAWEPDTFYTVGSVIIDSNGNLEEATTAGTSGAQQPVWAGLGGTTTDGIANSIVQNNNAFALASTVSVPYLAPVTHNNTLFAFLFGDIPNSTVSVSVTDTNGNSWTQVAHTNAGDQHAYLYSVLASANAGATTVTATFSSPAATGIWLGIAEIEGLTSLDTSNTNSARDYSGSLFNTGVVTTTNASDFLITFATFSNNVSLGDEIGNPPAGFQALGSQTAVQTRSSGGGHYMNLGAFCEFLTSKLTFNPGWSISDPQSANALTGITAAYETSVGTLVWTNLGKTATVNGVFYNAGLTPTIGYTYYYAFMNSATGHLSNVSVASGSTGPADLTTGTLVAQIVNVSGVGMQNTPSGPYGQDPQVDTIVVFRNTDGGAFFYQLATFPNPGNSSMAGTWTLNDAAPDNGISVPGTVVLNGTPSTITEALNNEIFAPIGLLNSIPPAGMADMDYFAGRMWGSVESFLYYNTSADNASLLGITQNGVPAESWAPANVIPFNAAIVRILAVGGGLLVCTTQDTWFVTGQNLLTGGFNPQKVLVGHGVRSYNAVGVDGSTAWIYTADRECLCVNPNSGSVEFGFPIGDLLEETFSPEEAYFVRHVSGSRDNAVFLADGSTGWYRLNPNQQGASMSGEQTPVWSPKANFVPTIGGVGAIASIETSPGVIQLLIGLAAPASDISTNLIRNPGFETGNLTDWEFTNGGDITSTVQSGNVHSGTYAAEIQFNAIPDGQASFETNGYAIPTIVGKTYTLSWWMKITGPGVIGMNAYAYGGEDTIFNQNLEASGWTQYSCTFVGTGSSANLEFGIAADNGVVVYLDDFSLTYDLLNPEPIFVRNLNTFTDNGTAYDWSATIGSILLATPGKLAEAESITTEMNNVNGGNVSATAAFDKYVSAVGLTSTFSIGPLVPTSVNELVILATGGVVTNGIFPAIPSNFTALPASTANSIASAQTSSAISGNTILNANSAWVSAMAAFFTNGQTPEIIQHNYTGAFAQPGTASAIFSNPNVQGNAILVVYRAGGGTVSATGVTVEDTVGNTYGAVTSLLSQSSFGTYGNLQMFLACNISAGANTVTATISGGTGNGFSELDVYEISNLFYPTATQCSVSVLLDEIAGTFESLPNSVNDPPQLNPSISVLSNRFYLSQGATPPICRHMQIQLNGAAVATEDELLALTVRGALVGEQV